MFKKTASFVNNNSKLDPYFPKKVSTREKFNTYYSKNYYKKNENPIKERIQNYDKIQNYKSSYERIRSKNYQSGRFRNSFNNIYNKSLKHKEKNDILKKEDKIISTLDEQIKNIAKNIRNLKVRKFSKEKIFREKNRKKR